MRESVETEPAEPEPGRAARTYRHARDTVRTRTEQVQSMRTQWAPLDIAFEVHERDREVNGNVFAGAVAFRLFLWMLPMALIVVAGLGFVRASGSDPEDSLQSVGVSGLTATSIADSLSRSSTSRWWATAIGITGVYFASLALAKVIHRVHALAWGSPESRLRSHPKVAGIVVGLAGVILVLTGIASRAPSLSGLDWGARLALIVLYGLVWIGVSWLLPHRDAPFRALIPGAVAVAVGTEVLHFVTVVYIVRKLNTASEVYGGLGTAFVLLFWLYLLGRLVGIAPVLNATLWGRSQRSGSP